MRFPGQVNDAATALYYNYYRDYDPSLGRYIQTDPIGLKGGINPYAYANGDPIGERDPSGEFAWIPFLVAGGGAVAGGYTEYSKAAQCGVHGWALAAATGRGALAGAGAALSGLFTGLFTDNPFVAGGAAGGSYDLINGALGGEFSWGGTAVDTGLGAIAGRVASGLTGPVRGGWNFNPWTSPRTWGAKALQLYQKEAYGHALDQVKGQAGESACACQ